MGLVKGHAYSITRVEKIDDNVLLIRIRNPWGNSFEWNGAWSDHSEEWKSLPEEKMDSLGITFEDDGEFWVEFVDFCTYWDTLEICHLSPDDDEDEDDSPWQMQAFESAWTSGETAGGCTSFPETFVTNPQFLITLSVLILTTNQINMQNNYRSVTLFQDPDEDDEDGLCTCMISLMQMGRREQGLEPLSIGFEIAAIEDLESAPRPLDWDYFKSNYKGGVKGYRQSRSMNERFHLEPGSYVIIPTTYNPDEEGEFLLRIMAENAMDAEEYY